MRWDPTSQKHRALTERILRPDSDIRFITELLVTEGSDVKATKSAWDAGTQTPAGAFETFDYDGSAALARTPSTYFSHKVTDGWQSDLNDASPLWLLAWEIFQYPPELGPETRFREFRAYLTRKRDPGLPTFNGQWALQIYTVAESLSAGEAQIPGETGGVVAAWNIAPLLSPPVYVQASSMAGDEDWITFDLQDYPGFLRMGKIPSGEHNHFFLFQVRAVPTTDDGEDAVGTTNVGWAHDSATPAKAVGPGDGGIRAYKLNAITGSPELAGDWYSVQTPARPPTEGAKLLRCELKIDQYPDPASGFSSLQVSNDLGAAPQSDTDIEVEVQDMEPAGTDAVSQISADSGATWYDADDGDLVGEDNTPIGGNDLSALPRQQIYHMRWRAKASALRDQSPRLFRLGIRERRAFDVTELVDLSRLASWQVDPVTLAPSIGESSVTVGRDGLRDFQDLATRIVRENEFKDIELRIFAGHPDLERRAWGLIEVLRVDDRMPLWEAEEFVAVSVLEQMKGLIPPIDSVSGKRIPVVYEDSTIKAAVEDLVDTQIGLPAAYRGQLLEDTTYPVTNQISESDGLAEVRALAYIEGKTLIASQGRVKAVNLHGPLNLFQAEILGREEVDVVQLDPGFRSRQPEMFIRFAYNWREDDEFAGEYRRFNTRAIAALGFARIDAEPNRPPEEVERWIPADYTDAGDGTPRSTILNDKGDTPPGAPRPGLGLTARLPGYLGTGLILAQVRLAYMHPWLEIGDVLIFPQDRLTGRDPITGREISGRHWLIGVIYRQGDVQGREFFLWVRGYADIIAGSAPLDRLGYGKPVAWAELSEIPNQPENVRIGLHAWPSESTTIFWIIQALDATVPSRKHNGAGWTSANPGDTIVKPRDASDPKKISVYAVHQGRFGAVTTVIIQPDKRAQIESSTASESGTSPNIAVKRTAIFDTQARRCRVYRRTGSWPTTDGTQSAPVDETYFKTTLEVLFEASFENAGHSSGETIRDIWIPLDVNGNRGQRHEASYAIQDSPSPQIDSAIRQSTQLGTDCTDGNRRKVQIDWSLSNASDANQDLKIYERVDGGGWVLVKTEASPVSTTSYTRETDYYEDTVGGSVVEIDYKLELVTGGITEDEEQLSENEIFQGIACSA